MLKNKYFIEAIFSIRKSLTPPGSRNNFTTLTQDLVVPAESGTGRQIESGSHVKSDAGGATERMPG